MELNIRVANRNILVHSVYPAIYNLCKSYWTEENAAPDVEIRIDESMIRAEAERIRQADGQNLNAKSAERLLVHRLVSEALLSFDTLLMHGAVVALDGAAYMFTAKSGTGKTTHIQNWLENIGGAYVVNGDKPFLIVGKDGVLACGSPWAGKENLNTNTAVPLKSIVLLERAEENRMERIPFIQAFPALLQQTHRPDDPEKMRQTLRLLQRMNHAVFFWRFHCNNFKDDCLNVAYNALVKGQI